MSHESPPPYFLQRTFSDVDDLAAEAEQWNVDFRQLNRGKFRGHMLQFGAAGVHISDARFRRSLNQKGQPPAGLRTVAIPAGRDMRLEWRGKHVDGNSLMVFPRGSELSSVSASDFHIYTCSFPEEFLTDLGEAMEIGTIEELCGGVDAFRVPADSMEHLRTCLFRICNSVRASPNALSNATTLRQLTHELPSRLISAMADGVGKCLPITGPRRRAAVERAEEFIERNAGDHIGVSDVCQAAGVSERTLQYAFLQKFGISPKEYLTSLRLIRVRRELRRGDPTKTKVAEVANAWGFWHMGQFAADYRRRFEELPSETLRFPAQ